MKSLEIKVAELRAEVERERRREQDAAAARIMRILRTAYGSDLENRLQGLSTRLLADEASYADRRLLASLPTADLTMLATTAEQWIVLQAAVFAMY